MCNLKQYLLFIFIFYIIIIIIIIIIVIVIVVVVIVIVIIIIIGSRAWDIYATCTYHLPQQAEWQTNVADIIVDWPNLYRPRKESLTQQQYRG